MANWIELGRVDDFPAEGHVCTQAAGESIIVCRLEGAFYALRNVCPHAGKPLGEGERHGAVIVCPYHGHAYNLRTGRNADWPDDEPPCRRYETTTADGRVYVNMDRP